MNSVIEALKKYPALAGTAKKEALEKLLAIINVELTVYDEIFGENQRAALRFLADVCKKKIQRESIAPLVVRDIDKLLSIKDDKARKVACMLIGICAPNDCAVKLAAALKNEKTRFVRPSIILALGNTDNPIKYLKNYIIEPGEAAHIEQR